METAIETFKENDIIPIACSLNNVPHYWIEFLMLYASGVDEYTSIPTSAPEGWVKGLEMFKTLRDMGAFPEDTDTVDDAYTGQLFRDKKAAMQLDGSWYAGNIEDTDNTVVIAFPGVPDQKAEAGSLVGGISSGFYITKKAWEDPDKRDAAVKFVMAHTCQAGVQRYWEATGAVSQAAVEVTPVEGATPFAQSIAEYTSNATAIVAPTDSRIGDAYKTLVVEIVKVLQVLCRRKMPSTRHSHWCSSKIRYRKQYDGGAMPSGPFVFLYPKNSYFYDRKVEERCYIRKNGRLWCFWYRVYCSC